MESSEDENSGSSERSQSPSQLSGINAFPRLSPPPVDMIQGDRWRGLRNKYYPGPCRLRDISRKWPRRMGSLPRNLGLAEFDMLHHEWEYDDEDSDTPSFTGSYHLPKRTIQRKKARSFEDLRLAPRKLRGTSCHATFSPVQSYSSSDPDADVLFQHRENAAVSEPEKQLLCENCLQMNIEKLAAPGGYAHSMLSEFMDSSRWCTSCRIIRGNSLLLDSVFLWTGDRYQFTISLNVPFDPAHSPECCTRETRSQICSKFQATQHPDRYGHSQQPPFNRVSGFTSLWVQVLDVRPWEPTEDQGKKDHYIHYNETEVLPSFGTRPIVVGSVPLDCLTREYDPAQSFGVKYLRPIGINTSSQRSLEIAAGWLQNCLSSEPAMDVDYPNLGTFHTSPNHWTEKHPGDLEVEPAIDEGRLPTQNPGRLLHIDFNSNRTSPGLQLIETSGLEYQYAALSYCWGTAEPGDTRPWRTLRDTIASHLAGIDRQKLPQTLKDAIEICERLQISYLWVDSLCIIQDSEDDWQIEADKMSGIYLGSLVTLSFSSALSAEAGCFNEQSIHTVDFETSRPPWAILNGTLSDGRNSTLYLPSSRGVAFDDSPTKAFQKEVLNSALFERAWALQEHVLPRRTLFFTSKQLFWECDHCRLSEDNYLQHQTPFYPICNLEFPLNAWEIVELWYCKIVAGYTRRKLTKETDRLVAISALARATYLNRRIDYIAGLWKDCIIPGLLWMRKGPGHKSKTYACPSWSWASQNSAVSYQLALGRQATAPQTSDLVSKVRKVSWKLKTENPFADVVFASIDLDVRISLGTVLRDVPEKASRAVLRGSSTAWMNRPCRDYHRFGDQRRSLLTTGSNFNDTLYLCAEMDDDSASGCNVTVALVDNCFLVLEPAGLQCQTYRRVGIATLPDKRGIGKVDIFAPCKTWIRRSLTVI